MRSSTSQCLKKQIRVGFPAPDLISGRSAMAEREDLSRTCSAISARNLDGGISELILILDI
jgi:hypothetical protein